MNKIKNAFYALTALAVLTPSVASAQWSVGQINAGTSGLGNTSLTTLLQNAMYWLLGAVGFLGVIGFVISGILYLTAAGDEDQIDKAKKAMLYSIIGVVVALFGYVIITAATSFFAGGTTF